MFFIALFYWFSGEEEVIPFVVPVPVQVQVPVQVAELQMQQMNPIPIQTVQAVNMQPTLVPDPNNVVVQAQTPRGVATSSLRRIGTNNGNAVFEASTPSLRENGQVFTTSPRSFSRPQSIYGTPTVVNVNPA
uniref:Uncharacterized protein n=1 Tax=Pithovirus LCPAC101 TaxID=2506586 RepID=A0A481Z4Z5_9VIRU|nr:MAG: hypothetical protein LCPAC101_03640 [Pithovirus LCPAC101]